MNRKGRNLLGGLRVRRLMLTRIVIFSRCSPGNIRKRRISLPQSLTMPSILPPILLKKLEVTSQMLSLKILNMLQINMERLSLMAVKIL
jgi:hypothetical protein